MRSGARGYELRVLSPLRKAPSHNAQNNNAIAGEDFHQRPTMARAARSWSSPKIRAP
jgi:hypothetical protein